MWDSCGASAPRIAGSQNHNSRDLCGRHQGSYVVLPSGFEKLRNVARQRDVGIATHFASGKVTAIMVGDSGGGGNAKVGEASVARPRRSHALAVRGNHRPEGSPRTIRRPRAR
jgi:hypothetical protein